MLIPNTQPHNITHSSRPRLDHQVHYSFIKHTVHALLPPTVQDDNSESRVKLHKNSNLQPDLGQSIKQALLSSLPLPMCIPSVVLYSKSTLLCEVQLNPAPDAVNSVIYPLRLFILSIFCGSATELPAGCALFTV